MPSVKARVFLVLGMLVGSVANAEAQKVHQVRLEVDREKETYQFIPSRLTASPGDIIAFKIVNGAPHGIVFESDKLSPAARNALSSALGAREGELSSPMLTKNRTEYRFVLPKLPAGTYKYFCLPHRAYDMRGEIVVEK